jgi:histidinol-phosphatase (PHP family)
MEASCAQAIELGLPSIAFTEHVDATRWVLTAEAESLMPPARIGVDGRFDPLTLDADGYLACVERCRERFPDLRILTGVELGEPHWFEDQSRALLQSAGFDRVLGSLHSLPLHDGPWLVDHLFWASAPDGVTPDEVVRSYLGETLRMIETCDLFEVLAHIDYPVRGWPAAVGRYDSASFEEEYRAVLRALATSGRVLEVNTRLPMPAEIVGWWYASGGDAVSFGSDAHEPSSVGHGFADAAAMVESCGFRAGRDRYDFWRRRPECSFAHVRAAGAVDPPASERQAGTRAQAATGGWKVACRGSHRAWPDASRSTGSGFRSCGSDGERRPSSIGRTPRTSSVRCSLTQEPELRYRSRRPSSPRPVGHDITVDVGDPLAEDGRDSLDQWLAGRWRAFGQVRGRRVVTPVEHEPWVLHEAVLLRSEEDLLATVGLPRPTDAPLVRFSPGVSVAFGPPRPVRPRRRQPRSAASSPSGRGWGSEPER